MPKKFSSENSKAVEAKARKAAASSSAVEKKKALQEEEYWKDDDKQIVKKQQRKEELEQKRLQLLAAKNERKALEDAETERLAKETKGKVTLKMTQAMIKEETEKREAAARGQMETVKAPTHITVPLPENVNRMVVEGLEARTVTEAISVLSVSSSPSDEDRHPERRLKAAYAAYEDKRLPVLRQENANMRLSQVKQLLQKEWRASPENPMNQRIAALNQKS